MNRRVCIKGGRGIRPRNCHSITRLRQPQIANIYSAWRLATLPVAWRMDGFEHSLDLSGIAAASATQCLVGSDESFRELPVAGCRAIVRRP
jgi:hypothetical protein